MEQQQVPDNQHTGVLILIDTPAGMELGFDNTIWNVQSKFKGIKNIPVGSHYLHFSLADQNHMFKVGKFYRFGDESTINKDHVVIVLKWNKQFEDFVKVTGYEETSIIQGVKDGYYSCYLGGYPSKRIGIWRESTNFITKPVLDKLDPIIAIHHIGQQYDHGKGVQKSQQFNQLQEMCDLKAEEQEIQNYQEPAIPQNKEEKPTATSETREVAKFNPIQGTIYYSQIPKKLNSLLEETTNTNLDKTQILQHLLKNEFKSNPLLMLGQLQYSMVSFLLGQSLQSLEQWKKLLNVICLSQRAFYDPRHTQFLSKFIVVLFSQLKQLPQDFFIDELSRGNFMVQCLRRLAEYQKDQAVPQKLIKRIKKIIELLNNHFGYYIENQVQEQMPVIVSQNQAYF